METDAIDVGAATKAVPDEVFGGLAARAEAEASGAKALFEAAKK